MDEIEAIIRQLEREGREATLRDDAATWERLLADTWVSTNADGSLTTKPQLLALLRGQPFGFVAIDDEDVHVQTYAEAGAAVVTGRSTRRLIGRDQTPITRRVRFTRVYLRLAGQWQVVAAQATPLA